jgi:hypothetical protein
MTKGRFMNLLDIVNSVRQHHALEHATIHVLSGRHPYVPLMGRSTHAGFHIYGPFALEEVADAAGEALTRLQQGEAYLAVHPRCGTNMAVTSVMAGTAAFGATLGRPRSKLERLPWALMAATVAALVSRPIADRLQERVTTTPEVDGVYIAGIKRQERGNLVVHKIRVGRE